MKKVFVFIIMAIIVGSFAVSTADVIVNGYTDYITNDEIISEFEIAFKEGEKLEDRIFWYDGCIYSDYISIYLDVSVFGFENFTKNDISELEKNMLSFVDSNGLINPKIKITYADTIDGKDIYMLTMSGDNANKMMLVYYPEVKDYNTVKFLFECI